MLIGRAQGRILDTLDDQLYGTLVSPTEYLDRLKRLSIHVLYEHFEVRFEESYDSIYLRQVFYEDQLKEDGPRHDTY